jgi:hypothetical protein
MSADDVEGRTEAEGGCPVGKKRAKKWLEEEKESLAESGRLMADESQRIRIITEKSFQLQEKELQERISAREERIMSRDVSQLSNTAKRFYELKQQQILQALGHDVYRGVEGD